MGVIDLLEQCLGGAPIAAADRERLRAEAPLAERLASAANGSSAFSGVSVSDLAVLIRGALREASVRFGRDELLVPRRVWARISAEVLDRHGVVVSGQGQDRLSAISWIPSWSRAEDSEWAPAIEGSLYSGPLEGTDSAVPADPFLLRIGRNAYLSSAQREAVRTVLSAPAGSSVVVLLPTGGGKSACAFVPALLPLELDGRIEDGQWGVTPVVVPTVSLALDLERRVREIDVGVHETAYRPGSDSATRIQERIRLGIQGPVFASPEAIVGSLRQPLERAAAQGFVRHFVVDEAHMVSTWGDEFRPAFQQVAAVCRNLRGLCPHQPLVTILMTATLTGHGMRTLCDLFAADGNLRVVHAVRLRPEPRYVWKQAQSVSDQEDWMLEALRHIPRPAILYTTLQSEAIRWYRRLSTQGHRRLGMMHGATSERERERILAGWKDDSIDLMVATSAFGLGVDKPNVRAVLHATFPESLDRYYQEVGRGGRDGRASLALMHWTERDVQIARGLATPTFISPTRGLERWGAMFEAAGQLPDGRFEVATDARPLARPGDIDMEGDEHERWNVRTLLLLQRVGAIELSGDERTELASERYRRFVTLKPLVDQHLSESYWAQAVEPVRRQLVGLYAEGWDLMQSAVKADRCLAYVLDQQYSIREHGIGVVRVCGSCRVCQRRGQVSTVSGVLRARHSPTTPDHLAPTELPPSLAELLSGQPLGIIFFEGSAGSCDVLDVAKELVRRGIRDFILETELQSAWLCQLSSGHFPPVYFHADLPSGVRSGRPALAVIGGNEPSHWRRIETVRRGLPRGSVLVVSREARDADRPDRRLEDTLVGSRWPLHQFLNRYVA